MAKNRMADLRNHLFETIEALKDPDNPMDPKRAMAIGAVAGAIIGTAKLEIQYLQRMKRDDADARSEFLEPNGNGKHAALPVPAQPAPAQKGLSTGKFLGERKHE